MKGIMLFQTFLASGNNIVKSFSVHIEPTFNLSNQIVLGVEIDALATMPQGCH